MPNPLAAWHVAPLIIMHRFFPYTNPSHFQIYLFTHAHFQTLTNAYSMRYLFSIDGKNITHHVLFYYLNISDSYTHTDTHTVDYWYIKADK